MNELFRSTIYDTVTVIVYFKFQHHKYHYFVVVESKSPYQASWSRQYASYETPPNNESMKQAAIVHHAVFKHVRKRLKKASTRLLQRSHFHKLWLAQEQCCYLCDEKMTPHAITIDHVVPLSKGGKDSNRNKLLTHGRCNTLKGNRLPTEEELDKLRDVLSQIKKTHLHRID